MRRYSSSERYGMGNGENDGLVLRWQHELSPAIDQSKRLTRFSFWLYRATDGAILDTLVAFFSFETY